MKKTFLLILSALLSISVFAQNDSNAKDYRHWSLMLKGGFARNGYSHQGIENTDNKVFTGIYGIEIERTFNPLWGLGISAQYYDFYGSFNIPWAAVGLGNNNHYNIFVSGEAIEAAIMGSVNLSNLLSPDRSERARKFNVYFRAGIGYTFYKTDQYPVMEQFWQDRADNISGANSSVVLATNRDTNFSKNYEQTSFVIPTELQFEYNFCKPLSLGLILGQRWHSSDHFGMPDIPVEVVNNNDVVSWKRPSGNNRIVFFTGQLSLRYKFGSTGSNNHIRNYVPELKEEATFAKAFGDTPINERLDMIDGRLNGIEARLNEVDQALRDHDFIMQQLAENKVNFAEENLLIIPTVEFDIDSHVIRANFSEDLDILASALRQQPNNFTIQIAGHTDNTGSAAHNERLSQDRANAVKAYLQSKGVQQQMVATGFGKRNPVVSNNTEEGRQRNRRVEIRFTR